MKSPWQGINSGGDLLTRGDSYQGRQTDPLSLNRYTYCHSNPVRYNAHGDVVMLIGTLSGAIAGTYRYDAFGNVIAKTGDVDNSITYAIMDNVKVRILTRGFK